ncbi:MAG: hypothetical protein OEO77_10860 [Acidimicrobiia bacterium]|nr:hypothetical protein [Acidimicrobiia bacterium]
MNSECDSPGLASCEAQSAWLQADLATHARECMLAYWHRPVFNSGVHVPGNEAFSDEWAILDRAGVDFVVNGHDHNYQRYAPQDASGVPDPSGMRQFIVGSGGNVLYEQSVEAANLEEFYPGHGVLKLDLMESSFRWTFLPTQGSYSDNGSGTCRTRFPANS